MYILESLVLKVLLCTRTMLVRILVVVLVVAKVVVVVAADS